MVGEAARPGVLPGLDIGRMAPHIPEGRMPPRGGIARARAAAANG
jgi:hypothetical protein